MVKSRSNPAAASRPAHAAGGRSNILAGSFLKASALGSSSPLALKKRRAVEISSSFVLVLVLVLVIDELNNHRLKAVGSRAEARSGGLNRRLKAMRLKAGGFHHTAAFGGLKP